MQSFTIFSLLSALCLSAPVPVSVPVDSTDANNTDSPAQTGAPSGLITFISGVLTTPYQCGSYASNNVCASGYSCIDGKCVDVVSNPIVSPTEPSLSSDTSSSSSPSASTAAADIQEPVTAVTALAPAIPADQIAHVPDPAPFIVAASVPAPVEAPVPAPAPAPIVAPVEVPVTAPVPAPAAPAPVVEQPVQQYTPPPPPPPAPSSSATMTFYEPSTGPAFCNGQTYSSSSYVVAMATDILGSHCGSTVTLIWGGRSVQATVVDKCNVADGCRGGNIDTTTTVWAALGANLAAGVLPIQYHF